MYIFQILILITPYRVVLNADSKYPGFISIRYKTVEISTKIQFDQTFIIIFPTLLQ